MKIIRWWGIAAFIVIVLIVAASWFLLAPRLIASTIETSGSEALGAKVEVASVDLELFPLSVQINQLQATDPNQPMKNIFQADAIKMSIDSESLMWKKIVIDELVLTGAKTKTDRKTSGELKGGRQSARAAEELVELIIPDVGDININEMVDKADLITLKRIEEFKTSQKAIEAEWQADLDKEAFEQRTAKIKQEFDRLSKRAKDNKLNLIKDRKAWKKLKKDIDEERGKLSSLSKKIKSDKTKLSQQIASIKKGPSDDLDAIMSQVGLGNGIDGLVDKYLGPKYTPWVKRAIEISQSFKGSESAEQEESKAAVAVGNRVYFKDEKVFPDVLVKKIKLSGSDNGWELDGNGIDLGYLPWLTGRPAKLDIDLGGKGKAKLGLESYWQSKDVMKTELNSVVDSWPIEAMPLMNTSKGNWMINSGTLTAKVDGSMSLEKIDLKASFKVAAPKLSFPESLSGWQKGLAESINQQSSIQFELVASGELSKPSIRLTSSLENLFQDAIGAQLKEKAQALKGDVQAKLSEKVGDLSSLENYQAQFKEWQSALGDNENLLKGIKDKIKL